MKFFPYWMFFCFIIIFAEDWMADLGNGNYRNPVIFADYSDPDMIRVNDDFYLVASSFNCMPGIPVLHSSDLVNWQIIGHVYQRLPFEKYNKPAHGEGSWAPSIRYHNGLFYVYFCTPHEGLFMAEAKEVKGPWQLHHVVNVELWEDPCPFWDDDGSAYLVRSKLRGEILYLHRMSKDGRKILDNGTIIFQDKENQPIIEGPKLLKKDGTYYIFAPAGGVPEGWQAVLRSKNIYGPYEAKIVLHQGNTEINGPHQGGIVETKSGEWWFIHFQDRGLYGRIVHLQPVSWQDGWPLIGVDMNHDGIGEPVAEWKKPGIEKACPPVIPQTSDEFIDNQLGLQWQWQANPAEGWFSLTDHRGNVRLYAVQNFTQQGNLWFVPNLLLQKFPAPAFSVTARIDFKPDRGGDKCGLVVMGKEWAYIALEKTETGLQLGMYRGSYYQGSDQTEMVGSIASNDHTCYLKVQVNHPGKCTFFYSFDGKAFKQLGNEFKAKAGIWIGAKVGLFCINPNITPGNGYVDIDWVRFE
jgi:beta-xylosidase